MSDYSSIINVLLFAKKKSSLLNVAYQGLSRDAVEREGQLTISNALLSDSGEYTCTAIDLPRIEPATVILTVEHTCKSQCLSAARQLSLITGHWAYTMSDGHSNENVKNERRTFKHRCNKR